ncbi:N-formylglutamate deformylase [Neptunitalea chrysea]|uniref:N-formylglutamate deformylase n=1 Tax=Neptunitalea chrysea TaxID=1647581 RepID=A0A9W6B6Z0_9FLAO|nr:N-formylglutamate amidohydrolase [Neptunitalea chrysea]GLB52394.1 N-formylglutamate deformylase [Neptunitalea chrysea]
MIYSIIEPTAPKVPILISSPHSGTDFPEEIKQQLLPEAVNNPDDTDWFIDTLYNFASDMGITIIKANYNRWVIDLNRDPNSKPLYNDGRVITGLVPETDFNGNPLYSDKTPDEQEIKRRIEHYYKPYHKKVGELLQELKDTFGYAILFDAHSIRRMVPGIRKTPFPQLILGDNDETSAAPQIIKAALDAITQSNYEATHNHPFKGGYITRYFGKPEENIHALQLEMAKTNYMNASETAFSEENAAEIRIVLKQLFTNLIATKL